MPGLTLKFEADLIEQKIFNLQNQIRSIEKQNDPSYAELSLIRKQIYDLVLRKYVILDLMDEQSSRIADVMNLQNDS